MKKLKTLLILAIILFANTLQAQTSVLAKEITINKGQIKNIRALAAINK